MNESAEASETSANRRALSVVSSFLSSASWRTIGFQARGPVMYQKRPISVCSALRVVLAAPATSRISLRSRVQVSEVRAGGGGARNCDGVLITHGVTAPSVELTGTAVGM